MLVLDRLAPPRDHDREWAQEYADGARYIDAIREYGECMASKKVTVTVPEELLVELGAWSRSSGVPVSRLVSAAIEDALRRKAGLEWIAEYEAEHGAFTPAEIAEAAAKAAALDAELFADLGKGER